MADLVIKIDKLMKLKAMRDGVKRITQEDIATATKIPQGSISRYVGNNVDRFDKRVLMAL